MKNLAGDTNCDADIREELTRARIGIVELGAAQPREVPFSIMGKLGHFRFTRAWYYWQVEGSMPINVVRVLLDDPEGNASIRIDGHINNRTHKALDKYVTSGCEYVYSYHIDTQAGLRVFADTIRQFDLMNDIAEETMTPKEAAQKIRALADEAKERLAKPDAAPTQTLADTARDAVDRVVDMIYITQCQQLCSYAVLTSIEAKANNPNTTPAELKELALAVRAFSQTRTDVGSSTAHVDNEVIAAMAAKYALQPSSGAGKDSTLQGVTASTLEYLNAGESRTYPTNCPSVVAYGFARGYKTALEIAGNGVGGAHTAELRQVESEVMRLSERCAGLEQMAAGIVAEHDAKLTEAQATIAILEGELVSARRIASEIGARCDALQRALSSTQNNVSVLDAALDRLRADADGGCRAELHKILDTAHISDATIAERVKEAAGAVIEVAQLRREGDVMREALTSMSAERDQKSRSAARFRQELDVANEQVDRQRKTIRNLAQLLDANVASKDLVTLVKELVSLCGLWRCSGESMANVVASIEVAMRDGLCDRFDALRDAAVASRAAQHAQQFGVALHDVEKHEDVEVAIPAVSLTRDGFVSVNGFALTRP